MKVSSSLSASAHLQTAPKADMKAVTKVVTKVVTKTMIAVALTSAVMVAYAAEPVGLLETLHHNTTLISTVPDNGDQNPYAIVVAPVSAGTVKAGDVLVGNFNNAANLQGVGTTIVDYHPDTQKLSLFASVPHELKECSGGVGLSTAMTMLKSGWVIVGSTPSNDGTTGTKGAGCLLVIDPHGKLTTAVTSPNINDPWGNMAVVDQGDHATLFVSNAGFGVGGPEGNPPVFKQATVLRIELDIPAGQPPVVKSEAVIGSGFGAQADKGVFLVGPTGLVLSADSQKLYVSDAIGNRVTEIDNPLTRDTSAGVGRQVTADGFLHRPLAMVMTPAGHLLVTNALNGQVVEIDPVAGKQLYARWIDTDKAQSPPGNGDLFGIAMTPAGDGFYYVQDDVNTLVLAH